MAKAAKKKAAPKRKLSKPQVEALDRDHNGEAGGSLSAEEKLAREQVENRVGRAFRGY